VSFVRQACPVVAMNPVLTFDVSFRSNVTPFKSL
jgi:hypothetical protein